MRSLIKYILKIFHPLMRTLKCADKGLRNASFSAEMPKTKIVYDSLLKWSKNPVGIFLFKVNNGNTSTMCKICSKLTIKKQNNFINVVLVSSLLTLNRFQTLFWWFQCWLWTSKHRLGTLQIHWQKKRRQQKFCHLHQKLISKFSEKIKIIWSRTILGNAENNGLLQTKRVDSVRRRYKHWRL